MVVGTAAAAREEYQADEEEKGSSSAYLTGLAWAGRGMAGKGTRAGDADKCSV